MILERARVELVHEPDSAMPSSRVLVTAVSKQGCKLCDEGKGCGGGVFARLAVRSGPERRSVIARNPESLALKTGDEVMLGLRDDALVLGALVVYGLPLLTMLLAAGLAHWIAAAELLTALAGGIGLLVGFWLGARLAPADSVRYQPVIVRRADAAACGDDDIAGHAGLAEQPSVGYRV